MIEKMMAGSLRSLPWQRALVYGMGASGRAAARLLVDRGVEVLGVDDRDLFGELPRALQEEKGFEFKTSSAQGDLLERRDVVVVSPGVALDRSLIQRARAMGVPVVGEIELGYRELAAADESEMVAITGSNGKSTTTALAGALLEAAGKTTEICGNFGDPLSARLQGPAGRTFVVEVSSFQLESVETFRPRVAAYLNLAEDHLDRHRDLETYAGIKERIFARQRDGDVAVINGDDPRVVRASLPAGVRRRVFSRRGPVEDGCFVERDRVLEVGEGERPNELFRLPELGLNGPHNLENAMAAALVASSLGVDTGEMRGAFHSFRGLAHRMQRVHELNGVAWYDDSKGTNVAATIRSVESFADGVVHLILGGKSKGADFSPLVEVLERKAKAVYLIGESAGELEASLFEVVPCVNSGTLDRAVRAAARSARGGEIVLLSPACASFDQFESFAHRGEKFTRLVRRLPRPEGNRDDREAEAVQRETVDPEIVDGEIGRG